MNNRDGCDIQFGVELVMAFGSHDGMLVEDE